MAKVACGMAYLDCHAILCYTLSLNKRGLIMPTFKISGLPAVASVVASDEFEVNQSGTSRKATVTQLRANIYTETVFAVTDGATVNLDPGNGNIQTWTLGANRTPGQVNWVEGQSITLMIDDGAAHTITWTTLAVVWETDGGNTPTLATSGFTVIVLWKVGTAIYGARVGDA